MCNLLLVIIVKSGAILFGTYQRLKTMSGITSKIADSSIHFSVSIKIIGVTLDSNLNSGPCTRATSKSCFYHVHCFRQIHSFKDHFTAASTLVSSRFNYDTFVFLAAHARKSILIVFSEHSMHLLQS